MTLSILETIQANEFACNLCNQSCSPRLDNPDLKVCVNCLPDPVDLPYSCCPKCGWDSETKLGIDNAPVKYSKMVPDWEYGWAGGFSWTETWTCPECSTVFELDQSNV